MSLATEVLVNIVVVHTTKPLSVLLIEFAAIAFDNSYFVAKHSVAWTHCS